MSIGGDGDNKVKDTPEQKELAAVAAEKWNFAQQNLSPLEDQYIQDVGDMDSEANMSYIRGRTMQGQTQAQSQATDKMASGLGEAGIDPGSGRFQGEQHGLSMDLAESGGENLGRAQFEQDSQKIQGLQNVTAIGQGQAGQAQAGLSQLAQESSSNAISDAENAFNRRAANLQLVGNLAGAGARYGMQPGGNPSMATNAAGQAPTTDSFLDGATYSSGVGGRGDPLGGSGASAGNFGLQDTAGGNYDYAQGGQW